MKKRQCTLCPTGTVLTDVPKDKAICNDCAVSLMDGECTHACDCPCHLPGAGMIHSDACCDGRCHICETPIASGQWDNHQEHCHKSLKELQSP